MIVQVLVVAVLLMTALSEMGLATKCLRRFSTGRLAAYAVLVTAPLQVLSAIYARTILASWHIPSSVDAPVDGFYVLFEAVAITGCLILLSCGLSIVVLGNLFFSFRDDR